MNLKIQTFFVATTLLLISCGDKKSENKNTVSPVQNASVETDTTQTLEQQVPRKESINLFNLTYRDSSSVSFVSLSDIYPMDGTDSDSLVLPDPKKMEKKASQYFTLDKNYRKRFLSKTGISESDSIFIYDYAKNKLVALAIKNLKTAALINGYASEEDWPYNRYDYMTGFEISNKYLKGFSDYYTDVLVYAGKENPFVRGQLTPIKWQKTTAKSFPSKPLTKEGKEYVGDAKKGDTHKYTANGFDYFLQDYLDERKFVAARRLLVIDSKTKEVYIEKFYGRGEGTSVSPLNHEAENGVIQWTGKLFKNKPFVVFGFQYESFGCPGISFIDKSNEDVYIQCDNRH
ncbi:oxidoreductase [Flavobacterium foetidum]|uniref:oxidoreductase n=1 Tax=Flavobacterium foetidum TaxID=2026681 RepID=UPI0010757EF8|nr:oxidoreductase [Flavobacterium foetidum]KAF2514698.1 oxidoreductase [Flavobacterium foetidum]